MPDVNFEQCEGEKLVAGKIVTTNVDIADGEYYAGQALGMNSSSKVYGALDLGSAVGLQLGNAVMVEAVTITGGSGRAQVYTAGSELQKRGLVDELGAPLNPDQNLIENFRTNGAITLKN